MLYGCDGICQVLWLHTKLNSLPSGVGVELWCKLPGTPGEREGLLPSVTSWAATSLFRLFSLTHSRFLSLVHKHAPKKPSLSLSHIPISWSWNSFCLSIPRNGFLAATCLIIIFNRLWQRRVFLWTHYCIVNLFKSDEFCNFSSDLKNDWKKHTGAFLRMRHDSL